VKLITAAKAARGVGRLAVTFARDPRQLLFVPHWLGSFSSARGPLETRIPWLPHPMVTYLDKHMARDSSVFEYGGGGSTLWLAERVRRVITVEHDAEWFARIEQEIRQRGYDNCTVLLRPPGAGPPARLQAGIEYSSVAGGDFEEYVKVIDDLPDSSLDVVIVDGRSRAACLIHAAPKIRRGGMLILDDANRKRYEAAIRALGTWPRRDFYGLKPAWRYPGRATLWISP
jgi:hypothetical protein